MSRHKHVRNMHYDDYYDDDEDEYDEHFQAHSPNTQPMSPSTAQYLMPTSSTSSSLWTQPDTLNPISKNVQQVIDVVGDVDVEFARIAIEHCSNDVEAAIAYILDQEQAQNNAGYSEDNEILFDASLSGDINEAQQRVSTEKNAIASTSNSVEAQNFPDFRVDSTQAIIEPYDAHHTSISPLGHALQPQTKSKEKPSHSASLIPDERKHKHDNIEVFKFDTPSPDTIARYHKIKVPNIHIHTTCDKEKHLSNGTILAPTKTKSNVVNKTAVKPLSSVELKKRQAKVDEIVSSVSNDSTKKIALNMVVVGHVDAGKSTLMGHLLYLLGAVSQRDIHRFEKESREQGKASFMYAWVLDVADDERSRGVTVDIAVRHFETPHRAVTLLDAPGHRDFIPNMISGAAQADTAILVVDAITGEFESGFVDDGQTREHAVLIRSAGVMQLIVAINKLDNMQWSQARYNSIRDVLLEYLQQIGFKLKNIWPIPVSGLSGENVKTRSCAELNAWYSGPTLIELIDCFDAPQRALSLPFRFAVTDVFRSSTLQSLSVSGTVLAGCVFAHDRVLLLPANEIIIIKAIMKSEANALSGAAGERVELGVSGVSEESMIAIGSVLCDTLRPVALVTSLDAKILMLDVKMPIVKGSQLVFHAQSVDEPCTVKRLLSLLHKRSGEIVKKRPRCLNTKCSAVVRLNLQRALPLELYKECRALGRFTLRRQGRTVAVGIITELHA